MTRRGLSAALSLAASATLAQGPAPDGAQAIALQALNAPFQAWAQPLVAAAEPPAFQALVQQRDALRSGNRPLVQLSADITSAVADGERLVARGMLRLALDRLLQLQVHMPLEQVPSSRVQLLAAFLYRELGLAGAQEHARLGRLQVQFLRHATGRGDATDPVRVLLASEIGDWAQAHGASVTELQQRVLRGRQLVAVTLGGAVPGSAVPQLREVFFEIDPQGYATP